MTVPSDDGLARRGQFAFFAGLTGYFRSSGRETSTINHFTVPLELKP
jgi:hypothetical protein